MIRRMGLLARERSAIAFFSCSFTAVSRFGVGFGVVQLRGLDDVAFRARLPHDGEGYRSSRLPSRAGSEGTLTPDKRRSVYPRTFRRYGTQFDHRALSGVTCRLYKEIRECDARSDPFFKSMATLVRKTTAFGFPEFASSRPMDMSFLGPRLSPPEILRRPWLPYGPAS
jgi:hypothetical protein